MGKDSSGKAVFVPHTVTGDVVDAVITDEKPSFCTGVLKDIIVPSQMRAETPHCKYAGICGGCHFGHIKIDDQIRIKENILRQALRKLPDLPELKIYHDDPYGYRIRATLRVRNGQAGFYKSYSRDHVPVDSCPVMKPELFSKCAEWAGQYVQGHPISLSVIENPSGEAIALVEGERLPKINETTPFAGLKAGKSPIGKKYLIYETAAGGIPVGYGGFFQANRYLIDSFQSYAASLAGKGDVLELYAGGGFFTAAFYGKAVAVESNAAAVELAKLHGYPVECADVAAYLQNVKAFSGTVFVDPPREGVDKKSMAEIQRLKAERIVYVSCAPMTLGRDLLKLSVDYDIESIALFDMFPHTYHLETVVLLSRKTSGSQIA